MITLEDRLKEIAEIDAKIEAIIAYKEKKRKGKGGTVNINESVRKA